MNFPLKAAAKTVQEETQKNIEDDRGLLVQVC